MKSSFIVHDDQLEVLDHLTDEQAGQIFKALREYHKALKTEKTQSVNLGLDGLMMALFNQFKIKLDREFEAYKVKCEKNKANGLKGGRKSKQETEKTQSVNSVNSENPKNHDSDSDSDSDINKKNKQKKEFSFTLGKKLAFENLSAEYRTKLKEFIDTVNDTTNGSMSYEEFESQCIANGYQYKNFKLAYQNWQKKKTQATTQHTQPYQTKQQINSENIKRFAQMYGDVPQEEIIEAGVEYEQIALN